MHKRKLSGILQYGNRLKYTKGIETGKVIKFQEGGHVAVSQGYDWREDPYELMLLQQQAAKDNAKLRYSTKKGKTSSRTNKPVKSIMGDFDPIKGGLRGSRLAAQAKAKAMVNSFYAAVDENGGDWLYTNQATQKFDELQTNLSNINEALKDEKIEFDKLREGISENSLSAKAISTSGHAFGFTKDKGPAVISLDKYYENPNDFTIGTLTDLIEWKASSDTSGNNKIASLFLGDNALGDSDMRDMYIKDRGEVQFKINKGMVIATEDMATVNAGEEIGSVDQVLKNVRGVLSGGTTVSNPNMGTQELSMLEEVIDNVTTSVYNSEIQSNTRLRSSLVSQALQDNRVMTQLKKLPTDQRGAYMDKAIRALWIEKLISKDYPGKRSNETTSNDSAKITAEIDVAGGAFASMFDASHKEQFAQGAILNIGEGEVSKVYDYDSSDQDNILRMASIKFPARTGVLTPKVIVSADSKGDKEENFAAVNPTIINNLDVSRTYTLDGAPLDNHMPGSESAKDFLHEHATIEPGSKVDFVLMPVKGSNDEPVWAETYWVNRLKMKTREDYIKAYTAVTKRKPTFKAEDLVAGSSNDANYNAYKQWVLSGTNVLAAKDHYKKENSKNPNHVDTIAAKRAWDMAVLAEESVKVATKAFTNNSAQYGGVKMKLFGIYTVNYDDAYTNDGLDKAIIASAKSRKFGSGGVRPITSKKGENVIVNINKVDRGVFVEDIKSLKLIAPVMSMATRTAANPGQNWKNRGEVEKIERELTAGANAINALANPKVKNIVHLLY